MFSPLPHTTLISAPAHGPGTRKATPDNVTFCRFATSPVPHSVPLGLSMYAGRAYLGNLELTALRLVGGVSEYASLGVIAVGDRGHNEIKLKFSLFVILRKQDTYVEVCGAVP